MHFGFYLMIAALVIMGVEALYALYQIANFFLWRWAGRPEQKCCAITKTPRAARGVFCWQRLRI